MSRSLFSKSFKCFQTFSVVFWTVSTFELVTAEVSEVYSLLNPVLTPILSFVGLVQGDAGVTQEVSTAVGGILTSANGLLSAKGLKEIEL
ncbi:hypothetical protein BofuT4_uP102250.1 [Botrytis cinerea T4]|uniref:Uncharacterized protein n=1 Tax=Botryotinia fuckeliana (strain T4) TaxID=999810 RepID=G2YBD3_BOTF4|nr:hypothetical protein BofuT4_uP102250.1 [Botrytis cinerea T4]